MKRVTRRQGSDQSERSPGASAAPDSASNVRRRLAETPFMRRHLDLQSVLALTLGCQGHRFGRMDPSRTIGSGERRLRHRPSAIVI